MDAIQQKATEANDNFEPSHSKKLWNYLSQVNKFLQNKEIFMEMFDTPESMEMEVAGVEGEFVTIPVSSSKLSIIISPEDNTGRLADLEVLSSGERQILSMLYAVSQVSSDEIVLIDEPKLSLHIDWQRKLLKEMSEQLGERQIIVCTHSPIIGASFSKRATELNVTTRNKSSVSDVNKIDERGEVEYPQELMTLLGLSAFKLLIKKE